MNYLEILHKLKSLDLANKLSSDEIKKLINGLGFYTYKRIFKKGEFIIRTRPNYNGTFCAKSELSYPPKSKESQSHQRASLKNTNYFYGSLIGNNYSVFQNHKDFIGAIVTSISEQEFFKDEKNKCIYKITYGAWQVKKEFGVAVLVQNENFYDKSDYVKMIIDEYNIYISTLPEEKKNEIILVNKFICNEFGKQVKKGEEYDYLISASYTQRMFEEGLGGLIYPSFTMLGAGLNIVLKTEIVDNCLELVRAGECTIFKTSSGINVSHDRVASRIVSDGNFTFDINGTNKGKIACMFQAGIKDSISFLIKNEFQEYKKVLNYDKFNKLEKAMIDFGYIIELALRVSDLVKDKDSYDEKNHIASNIFSKSVMSALSVWCMTEEYADNVFKRKIYDVPSSFILLRSIFEAYKVFNHILVSAPSDVEQELRILLFKRHSKYEERDLCLLINGKDSYYEKLDREIKDLTNNIINNKAYLTRHPDEKKSLQESHSWCEKKYEPKYSDLLATEAGLDSDQNKMTNKFLSNYDHCMSFALEQIDFTYKSKEIDGLIKLVEEQTSIYLTLTIELFTKINREVSDLVSKEEYYKFLLSKYKDLISADLKTVLIEK